VAAGVHPALAMRLRAAARLVVVMVGPLAMRMELAAEVVPAEVVLALALLVPAEVVLALALLVPAEVVLALALALLALALLAARRARQ
jgi:hypothetical protein